MTFGLSPADYQLLQELAILPLKQQGARVWVFGSRARGDHRAFSDIDLLYSLKNELPEGTLAKIILDLEESHLPIKVDLVRDTEMAQSYRENVNRDKLEI
jgi:predicted nucleotidyltransferase